MTQWQGMLLIVLLGAIAYFLGSSGGPDAWDAFHDHPDGQFAPGSDQYRRYTPGLAPWLLLRVTRVPRRLAGVVYGSFWAILVAGFSTYVWLAFIR